MDAVLQKSMDMTVELNASGKSGRPGLEKRVINEYSGTNYLY